MKAQENSKKKISEAIIISASSACPYKSSPVVTINVLTQTCLYSLPIWNLDKPHWLAGLALAPNITFLVTHLWTILGSLLLCFLWLQPKSQTLGRSTILGWCWGMDKCQLSHKFRGTMSTMLQKCASTGLGWRNTSFPPLSLLSFEWMLV